MGALCWNTRRLHGELWEEPFRKKFGTALPSTELMFLMGTIHRFPDQWHARAIWLDVGHTLGHPNARSRTLTVTYLLHQNWRPEELANVESMSCSRMNLRRRSQSCDDCVDPAINGLQCPLTHCITQGASFDMESTRPSCTRFLDACRAHLVSSPRLMALFGPRSTGIQALRPGSSRGARYPGRGDRSNHHRRGKPRKQSALQLDSGGGCLPEIVGGCRCRRHRRP
jgi:hypothetical protein